MNTKYYGTASDLHDRETRPRTVDGSEGVEAIGAPCFCVGSTPGPHHSMTTNQGRGVQNSWMVIPVASRRAIHVGAHQEKSARGRSDGGGRAENAVLYVTQRRASRDSPASLHMSCCPTAPIHSLSAFQTLAHRHFLFRALSRVAPLLRSVIPPVPALQAPSLPQLQWRCSARMDFSQFRVDRLLAI